MFNGCEQEDKLKKAINRILAALDLRIVNKLDYESLLRTSKELPKTAKRLRDYELAEVFPHEHRMDYFSWLGHSQSQLRQDLFVLSETAFKRNGFFIEFGATNGIAFSNTYLLETQFGWTGILAEPAKLWRADLFANRRSHIETDCVWKSTGDTLLFNEVASNDLKGELSTIDSFSDADTHKNARTVGKKYQVNTISLLDLLKKYNAPKKIDYLSIDTEGSEFEILNSFDFDAFDIKIITCEHNHTPMQDKIFDLLTRNGYERKFRDFSNFDDWYVRR